MNAEELKMECSPVALRAKVEQLNAEVTRLRVEWIRDAGTIGRLLDTLTKVAGALRCYGEHDARARAVLADYDAMMKGETDGR